MLNIDYIQRYFWRLIFGNKGYQSLCEKKWNVCSEEYYEVLPAIYLHSALDRVTGVQPETNYEYELKRISGGQSRHHPTVAYQLNDVYISEGVVYKKGMTLPVSDKKFSLLASSERQYFDEAALSCSFSGNKYFGHWFTDDLTLTLLAQDLAEPVRIDQTYTSHQVQYSDLLNIKSSPVSRAHFKKLIFFDDFGQNSYKRERYEYIRSKLKSMSTSEPKCTEAEGVMLVRGESGVKRFMENEDEIAQFLEKRGFKILFAENYSARDISLMCSQAKIVVGVEGSQLVHGLFNIRNGGALLVLQPPFSFNNVYKDYTDCLGLRYGFVVGEKTANGFKIDTHDLAKTLDKLNV